MAPRFRQIVAELRQLIVAGELAPGDRVPSTRDITRQWGVAMATATKVLTELRHEGLVQPVPGVGTVVADARTTTPRSRPDNVVESATPPPRGVAADHALTLERVVAAAI